MSTSQPSDSVSSDPGTLTLRDYLAPIRARWKLVVAIVVVITAIVTVYSSGKAKTYTASTKVYVGASSLAAGQSVGFSSPESIADQATLLTSTEVAAQVAAKIGYKGSPAGLAATVTATPSLTTSFLTVTATEGSSGFAARVANAFAQEFIARNSQTGQTAVASQIATLQAQLKSLKGAANLAQRQTLQSQIDQLQLQASSAQGAATQIDVATPPAGASNHSPLLYGALAALASLIGSILLAYMLHRLDPRLQTVDQAAGLYDFPVLAMVGHDGDIDFFDQGVPGLSDRSRESFRELRVALDLAAPEQHFKTILVTSAGAGEGKSTVTRNLALAMAEAGRRTVVIDADLRKASLGGRLGVDSTPGITEVVLGADTLESVTRTVTVAEVPMPGLEDMKRRIGTAPGAGLQEPHTLAVVPAGTTPPNPPALLESPAFREMLQQLSDEYDVVVIDSTPVTAVSDAMPIMPFVNAIVLVARNEVTDRRSARRAADLIARVPGASIAGVVVNDVSAGEAAAYGGYGYGYGYAYGGRAD